VFLPSVIGSVRKTSFRDMWSRAPLLAAFRERQGQIGGNCGSCEHLSTCGGCRAVAHAYSGGDPLAGDPHCWIMPSEPGAWDGLAGGESLPV
jgi:radical SAM protein with 4Fe4S-binding SPASM domain